MIHKINLGESTYRSRERNSGCWELRGEINEEILEGTEFQLHKIKTLRDLLCSTVAMTKSIVLHIQNLLRGQTS